MTKELELVSMSKNDLENELNKEKKKGWGRRKLHKIL